VAPWHRWRPTAVLLLPLLALANLSVSIANGLLPDGTYGVWVVLIFVWIGQSQPPRASLAMGPVAAVAYALSFLFETPTSKGVVAAAAVSIPVAMLVGFSIARKDRAARIAKDGQRTALDILAAANLTDDLTGLGNRRRANVMLDSLEPEDALAILDLDHFKDVNDSLGHQAGDLALHDLGQYLRSVVRGSDSVARFGGEEFLVVLKGPSAAAPSTMRRLLSGWRSKQPVATLSAGLAIHQEGQSYDVTFANADAALYKAKQHGRDRLVVHDLNAAATAS
jgi:diguanylate cyclase (GGDEF)-like protein